MRHRQLPLWASADLWSVGPRAGEPNKSPVPTSTNENGAIPGQPLPAQHFNYQLHHQQKQIEISANLPFRNLQYIGSDPFSGGNIPRCAFVDSDGLTLFPVDYINAVPYFPDAIVPGATVGQFTLTPAAGSFQCLDVAYVKETSLIVLSGANASATTKNLWIGNKSNALSEFSTGITGPIARLAVDHSGNAKIAGFFSDTTRKVVVVDTNTFSSVNGARGSGAVSLGLAQCALHDGLIMVASMGGGQINIEWTEAPYSSFVSTTLAPAAGDSSIFAVRYSLAYGVWMILTDKRLYVLSAPDSVPDVFEVGPASGAPFYAGSLYDSGSVVFERAANEIGKLWISPALGATPFAVGLGYNLTGGTLQDDGSALWVRTSDAGGAKFYRSMRAM